MATTLGCPEFFKKPEELAKRTEKYFHKIVSKPSVTARYFDAGDNVKADRYRLRPLEG
ncbi:10079_t:CDS:2 [Funneliformis caledonium]|uniref:10079_t:CDS:1 n=1 Tax=Funneliformis caledonium TaxID=1117310 RepID=A0A9N8WNW8_9GLOM|nr:10079_t:CDS:2 [Funneliformis caledonium]